MTDGPLLRSRMKRAQDRAAEADKAIRLARAALAQAVHPFKRWRLRLAIFFAERERASALRAHQKAKHRLMAMVI